MVTRAATESNLGNDFVRQIFSRPRPLLMAGSLLLVLFLVPGFPKMPLLLVGGFTVWGALALLRGEKQQAVVMVREQTAQAAIAAQPVEDPLRLLAVDTLLVELGSSLVPLALPQEGGDLADRVGGARRQIVMELGIILPMVRIRDNLQLRSNQYVVKIRDQVVATYDILPRFLLAIDPGTVAQPLDGLRTNEPAFGGPAIWIPKAQRERAELSGYIVTDSSSVIITHLTEIIKQHAHELLSRQEVQTLIDNAKQQNKVVIEELIPELMTLGEIQKVLQNLLRERVSIRDLAAILETLADWAPRTKDTDQLTEHVRAGLSRQLCKQHIDDNGVLNALTLEPAVEQSLRESVQMTSSGVGFAIDPGTASSLIKAISSEMERVGEQGHTPVLLCSSQIRLPLKRLTERNLPTLAIMAYNEIIPKLEVHAIGLVNLNAAGVAEIAA